MMMLWQEDQFQFERNSIGLYIYFIRSSRSSCVGTSGNPIVSELRTLTGQQCSTGKVALEWGSKGGILSSASMHT